MRPINLLCHIPNAKDATSLYRGLGPLAELRRRNFLQILIADDFDETSLDVGDVVFMQRPYTEKHLMMAKHCKAEKKPLWIDYDDFLFGLTPDNPAFEFYGRGANQSVISQIVQIADVVTVTTTQLKDCLKTVDGSLNPNIRVIPNALPDKYLHLARPYQPGRRHVLWRGSASHERDVMEFTRPILQFAGSRSDVSLSFMGYNPWFLTNELPKNQAVHIPSMTPGDYFRAASEINPSIMMVPLHKSLFNLCKSNIAWLEGTLFGAVSLVPKWPEWSQPGAATYESPAGFLEGLVELTKNDDLARSCHEKSWAFIQENLVLSKVNQMRMEIIQEFVA